MNWNQIPRIPQRGTARACWTCAPPAPTWLATAGPVLRSDGVQGSLKTHLISKGGQSAQGRVSGSPLCRYRGR